MFISGGERSKRAGSPPFFKKCVQTLHGRIDIARSCSTFCFDQIYFIRGDSSKNEPSITFSIVISLKGMSSVIVRAKRSEEHTSELQSLMRISYAVFCLKKK